MKIRFVIAPSAAAEGVRCQTAIYIARKVDVVGFMYVLRVQDTLQITLRQFSLTYIQYITDGDG